jgi:hypothetical protein
MAHRRLLIAGVVLAVALLPVQAAAARTVVVSPGHMHGWVFVDDTHNTTVTATGRMVLGPGDPPLGHGSAELAVIGPNDRQMLATLAYSGTPIKDIRHLSYWTYEVDPAHAMPFQFDIRYHPADPGYQGRLVFEPGNGNPAPTAGAWQQWTPLTGKWWASNQTASGGRCPISAPCTWQQVLTNWPAASILYNVLFKAGGGWSAWSGNVDAFTISVHGHGTTTYDFEPAPSEGDGGGDPGDGDDQQNDQQGGGE